MKDYETEASIRWGGIAAYLEQQEKTKKYTSEKWAEATDGLLAIFAAFAACRDSGAPADSAEARKLTGKLQAHITENFYTCTDEFLAGLGRMYTADERFRENIDKHGAGTAAFASAAIDAYCKERKNA